MKVLLVHPGPHFSVADVHDGLHRALLELGCQTGSLNLQDRLTVYTAAHKPGPDGTWIRMFDDMEAVRVAAKGIEAVCFEWWPDAVIFVSCFFVPLDTLAIIRARGIKVVIAHTESPYEDDRQLVRAAHADLNVVNDPTNLARFAELGPALYLPHCYDPAIHHRGPSTARPSDFAFVGTAYPSRVEFLEAVDWSGVDVALGGNWDGVDSPLLAHLVHPRTQCLDNADTAELYRATKVSANLYRREAERPELSAGWAMGPREVELAATGRFFLRDPRGEGDEVLSMLPTFDGPGDFAEQLRWWLAHPAERALAEDMAEAAVADRTFTNNARTLLGAVADPKEFHHGQEPRSGKPPVRRPGRRRQRVARRLPDEMAG